MGLIVPPSCWQYKPATFLAVRSLNWDEIFEEDDDGENWADPDGPSSGCSCPRDGSYNHDRDGEENRQGGEAGSGTGKGTMNGKRKERRLRMGRGKGRGRGRETVKGEVLSNTPQGEMIIHMPLPSNCRRKWMRQSQTWRAN
jgi:hypothetical protein